MDSNHFNSSELNSSRILKDGFVQFAQFLDGEVFCRKEEEEIFSKIKPITHGNPCQHLFIHGPNGSGKTTLVKHVLGHLKQYSPRVIPVYVNCWHHSTSMAIYTKIADSLGEAYSRRGRAVDEIFDDIVETMRFSKTAVLLILDELDGLLQTGDTRILHNLSRMDLDATFGIISISEDLSVLSKLPSKLRDNLRLTTVGMNPHTKDQLLELLKNRARKCLLDTSHDDDLLELIASIEANNSGSARVALEMLWDAAKYAESKGKNRIDSRDVEHVSKHIKYRKKEFSLEELLILEILEQGQRTTPELYSEFLKSKNSSKRHIRNYLHLLEKKGVVELRPIHSGNYIQHTLVKLTEGVL